MKRIANEPALPSPAVHARWQARLALGFADDRGVTRLVDRSHSGPLRVQKPLYPEGGEVCHAIVVHPPGGVVGGDELAIEVRADAGAHALLTTPGAAKWYKANGRIARQQVTIAAAERAGVEWLPQEAIFFDAAQVELEHEVELAPDATYIGWDILCFGRTAAGEKFASGSVAQRTSIRRGGKLLWFEQGALAADGSAMQGPLGLAGKTVCATLIGVGPVLPAAVLAAIRALDAGNGMFGATQMKSVLVARYLGDSSEHARQLMTQAWRLVRPLLGGREAVVPRIWNT